MKVAIIGAGISGISASKLLSERGIVSKVFERSEKNGGLISCEVVNGVLFHKVGGHVFNTKDAEVKEWFFNHFDISREFTNAPRNAKIEIKNTLIDYPIENHIYQLPEEISKKIISELLESTEIDNSNFKNYLKTSFGKTLFELYFNPYNEKIWRKNLEKISLEWLKNKLPMPDKVDILLNNIYKKQESNMAHSTFYYPLKGGSQFIIDRLSNGLTINNNCKVENIKKVESGWLIENEYFTHVIYTGNVKALNGLIKNIEIMTINDEDFQSHGTTTVLCTVKKNDLSWLYLPENYTKAHIFWLRI